MHHPFPISCNVILHKVNVLVLLAYEVHILPWTNAMLYVNDYRMKQFVQRIYLAISCFSSWTLQF